MTRIYLDTNIIVSRILKDALFEDYNRIWSKIEKYHEIVVPQIVLGETLTIILAKSRDKDNHVKEFTDLLLQNKILFKNNIPSLNRNILRTALIIKEKEEFIDYCDAVLVAHAINDGRDCWVFTTDKQVHDSQHIFEMIQELKNNSSIQLKLIQDIP